ncbi:MAG: T9SS C-terminal target domain-containing protein [Bacteroidetes bacterium]|nr:MAG: T9SS C-terminal target domain-containing protein [Bacteroidota bacterium]
MRLLLTIGLFLAVFLVRAQHLPGELIVELASGVQAKEWQQAWNSTQPPLTIDRQLSRPANIWLFRFDPQLDVAVERNLLKQVQAHPSVNSAQFNHTVELRSLPNDPMFGQQWWLNNTTMPANDLAGDEAWDITTGGLTALGDTIVVAVIDNGVDLQHEDLQANLWINHGEIPDNNIDDDQNGYVDDYRGWNILTDDDEVSGGGHGTSVAGILGADGNNHIGVAGVNWNVKLMIIKNNFFTDEARVIEAYSYPLEQRIRYNESGGQQGAFVVATNASWGRRMGVPADAPTWCNFYDFLGQHGILNVGATVNDEFDVDEVGDLPSTCTSDFLIAVTNIDRNNQKVPLAGFGATSIDLAAYGKDIFTTANGNGYRNFSGTSAATPMVAGAAALLYSVDCPTLLNLTQSDPAAAALLVKESILESVTPTASLNGITTTGGRLNLAAAIQYLQNRCQGCIGASSLRVANIIDTSVEVRWNTNDSLQRVDLRWREAGATNWQTITDVQSPYTISGLMACTEYEYEIRSVCRSETIPFGNRKSFQTEGCCVAPDPLAVSNLSNNSVRLQWASVFAATAYGLRYRAVGTPDWVEQMTNDTTIFLSELSSCTTYEYQLRTHCGNEFTPWQAIGSFTTLGCGPCLDLDYCIPDDMNSSSEYIQRVEFPGLFTNTSQRPTDGYTDYGNTLGLIAIEQGARYPFELTPAYVSQEFDDAWRIWIDLDHNGQFTSNEIMYTSPQASNEPVQGSLQIPADARLGLTRMRIMLRFLTVGNACPFGDNNFGEVEDYCVEIVPSTVCPPPGNLMFSDATPTGVTLSWAAVGPAVSYRAELRPADETDWQLAAITADESLRLTGLDSCTAYLVRVKSVCFASESETYRTIELRTDCMSSTADLPLAQTDWTVYPNPVQHQLTLAALRPNFPSRVQVKVYNSLGQRIAQDDWQTREELKLRTTDWQSGFYTITLWHLGRLLGSTTVIK